ncbi:MAG: chromosome partitioning protein ParA, partial [Salinarchaeum sp.]
MADLPADNGPTLHDVLADRASVEQALHRHGQLTLLPGGRSLAALRAADPVRLVSVLEALDDRYDRVVVDCPAGLAADVGLALYAADRSVLVTTPDHVALPDAVRTRALVRVLDAGVQRVVLNKAGAAPPTDAVREALGIPVEVLPADDRIADATAAGQPVVIRYPDTDPAEATRRLVTAVFD